MSSRDLCPFAFQDTFVRVINVDGTPWWVASDVAKALGYRDAEKMVRKLDDDQKGTHLVRTLEGPDTPKAGISSQGRDMTLINESGLWHCIIRSNRPEAKPFQRWLTDELLPTLRRQGFYIMPGADLRRPASVSELLRTGRALKVETNSAIRAMLWARMDWIADSWGIARPERAIGCAEPDYTELLGEFWSAISSLDELGIETNLSRRNDLIALNLPMVRAHFEEIGIPLEIDRLMMQALRTSTAPRYLADKPVNCRDGKFRSCWVFSVVPQEPVLP